STAILIASFDRGPTDGRMIRLETPAAAEDAGFGDRLGVLCSRARAATIRGGGTSIVGVCLVAGARPNYMKIAPIHRSMRAHGGFSPLFVHTGQHYDWEMSAVIMRDLGLPPPDVELDVGSGTHAQQTAHVMLRLEPVLAERRPAVVVVVGDVNSTVAAALAAAKLRIPVAHVEAGLRSFDRSMPEELNRVVTDVVSDVLFAPSPDAVHNLAREGIDPKRVHLVGNVMIDSLEALLPLAGSSDILRRLDLEAGRFVLTTLHRPSNV